MSLFQPGCVVPDVRTGIGSGTIDATEDLVVSWRINGPSAMTDYSVTIYENTAQSTQLYTTGKITLATPVYGTSNTGEPQFFSTTIDAADLATAGITNGGEYKLVIQQWWGATDAESVTQSSASIFITRAAPVLAVNAIGTGGVIATRDYTFTGSYTQAQGDVLNWLRWQLARVEEDGSYTTLWDSGNISGTMALSLYYDGFFTDTDYAVRLSVQTENGAEADTGWVDFSASYPVVVISDSFDAGCVGGTDAVLVDWSSIGIIPGEAIGPYSISADNILTLPAGSEILWTKVGTGSMSFAAPWSVVWRGTLGFADAVCFAVVENGGNEVVLRYDISSHSLILEENGTALVTQTGIINAPLVTAILTADAAMASGVGPAMGPGRTGQPGAGVIWGLALTSKREASASLECPAMVGVERGRLVPIKLQRPPERVGRVARGQG